MTWLYWGAWCLLGLFMASQDIISWGMPLSRRDILALIVLNVGQYLVWGLLSLATLWVCRRFPLHHRPPGTHWLGHLAASLLIVPAALVLGGGMSFLVDPPKAPWAEALLKFVAWYATFHYLICYWGVVGIHEGIQILESHQREEVRISQLESQLAEARLQDVRAQLSPHFLFNALNTLSAVMHSDPGLADRILVRLSQFLRTSLEQSREDLVTLDREAGYLQDYLSIEGLRFGNGGPGLSSSIDLPGTLQGALVPPFLLQPLVENAIKHGHPAGPGGLRIEVRARRDGSFLDLDIIDNGMGGNRSAAPPPGTGLGLRSTRLRLEQVFGAEAKLELLFPSDGGARVRIRIPLLMQTGAFPARDCLPVAAP